MNSVNYRLFCKEFGFISKKGNFTTSAEIAYRFIMKNPAFNEEHTALSDAKIEFEIFQYCDSRKKKYSRKVVDAPWKIVQKIDTF